MALACSLGVINESLNVFIVCLQFAVKKKQQKKKKKSINKSLSSPCGKMAECNMLKLAHHTVKSTACQYINGRR